ncbi:MAG: acyl-CoA dehydrogenase family protein [Sphingobium sp.]
MNQAPPLEEYDAFALNTPLREAASRAGADWALEKLHGLGAIVGSAEGRDHAERSDRNPPVLERYDGVGDRVDRVVRDPSWHWLVDRTVEYDLHGMTFRKDNPPAHAARAAMILTWSELSLPTVCPVSANYAIMPALAMDPALQARHAPGLLSTDSGSVTFAAASMTERQGGSDIRGTATVATPQADGSYSITGQKWFVTCPWGDVVLVLARAPGGLTCFVVESAHPGYRIERLKDKLGWHALGVGEVELHDAPGHRIGEEGKGVGVIMRMISFTRLDVMLENAAVLRVGTMRAIHNARHRHVLGKLLTDHGAMRNVLADLALESEAATAGVMHVAGSYDIAGSRLSRIALTLMKYWLSKRAAGHAAEALECLGGNGYVEASGMPRLMRDSVVGSVWEGSGNVAALDILRVLHGDPESVEQFLMECEAARGGNALLDQWIDALRAEIRQVAQGGDPEWNARLLTERMALAFQGSVLMRFAPNAVSDAFCAGRLGPRGMAYGTLPPSVDVDALLARALPA